MTFLKKDYQGMIILAQRTLHSAEKGEPNRRKKPRSAYSVTMRFWQGTVFLMQVPLRGSTFSTMTNGASSKVTILR